MIIKTMEEYVAEMYKGITKVDVKQLTSTIYNHITTPDSCTLIVVKGDRSDLCKYFELSDCYVWERSKAAVVMHLGNSKIIWKYAERLNQPNGINEISGYQFSGLIYLDVGSGVEVGEHVHRRLMSQLRSPTLDPFWQDVVIKENE